MPPVGGIELRAQALELRQRVVVPALHRMRRRLVFGQQAAHLSEAFGRRFEHGLALVERRLLRNPGQAQPGPAPHLPIVGCAHPRQYLEQAALAGAVAADQRHLVARIEAQLDVVEQRYVSVGERHLIEGCDWHGARD